MSARKPPRFVWVSWCRTCGNVLLPYAMRPRRAALQSYGACDCPSDGVEHVVASRYAIVARSGAS